MEPGYNPEKGIFHIHLTEPPNELQSLLKGQGGNFTHESDRFLIVGGYSYEKSPEHEVVNNHSDLNQAMNVPVYKLGLAPTGEVSVG